MQAETSALLTDQLQCVAAADSLGKTNRRPIQDHELVMSKSASQYPLP